MRCCDKLTFLASQLLGGLDPEAQRKLALDLDALSVRMRAIEDCMDENVEEARRAELAEWDGGGSQ